MKAIIWVSVPIGLCMGLGVYVFHYGKGFSYFRDEPGACLNCHVMKEQFDGWVKSTHHAVATCNDCHTPPHLVGKYKTKAINGFWHSFYFTTGNFPEPIQIKSRNIEIAENNCRRCHQDMVMAMEGGHAKAKELSCLHCHTSVGH